VLSNSLYFYDDQTLAWVAYNAGTHPFVFSFDVLTGLLIVDTSDFATYDPDNAPATVIKAKVVTKEPLSTDATGTVEDEFEITFRNACAANKLTASSNLAEFLYIVASGESAPITMTYTSSDATCPVVVELQVFNPVLSTWEDHASLTGYAIPLKSFDPTTGVALIETADADLYSNFEA